MPRHQIDFEVVRKIASAMPDVEEVTSSLGSGLKVHAKLLACPAIHATAEPNTLMVRVSFEERARLLAAEPDTYYVTDHYLKYPAVLVRLSRISRDALRDLLGIGWLFVSAKTAKGGPAGRKRAGAKTEGRDRPKRPSSKRRRGAP